MASIRSAALAVLALALAAPAGAQTRQPAGGDWLDYFAELGRGVRPIAVPYRPGPEPEPTGVVDDLARELGTVEGRAFGRLVEIVGALRAADGAPALRGRDCEELAERWRRYRRPEVSLETVATLTATLYALSRREGELRTPEEVTAAARAYGARFLAALRAAEVFDCEGNRAVDAMLRRLELRTATPRPAQAVLAELERDLGADEARAFREMLGAIDRLRDEDRAPRATDSDVAELAESWRCSRLGGHAGDELALLTAAGLRARELWESYGSLAEMERDLASYGARFVAALRAGRPSRTPGPWL